MLRARALVVIALLFGVAAYQARTWSQPAARITTPFQQFGANVGDDYFLATYKQFEDYWKKLDAESDRVRLVSIGSTEEGRTQWMAIVSAPGNLARLDDYKHISRRLALADVPDETAARALAQEGKAVVWIDGGLHADETLGAQQLIETAYQLASADDPETLRFLRDTIVLLVHANPDGHALVADWYMRERDPRRRSLDDLPRAYQKYVGHDNNRDFYLGSQAETVNMNRILYKEWFPQIVYDHHQPGPAGSVMFAPPFRGSFNHVVDPLVREEVDLIGSAMQARFVAEGKRGVTRGGSTYSTWWNGGLRTTAYFHNQIGLLTETAGDPTPMDLPGVRDRQEATADMPLPITPQRWHFRQSIDYSLTANRAVLAAASSNREAVLFNAYRMARNAIDAGNHDSWMLAPGRDARARDRRVRAPRAYVLPSTQPDFPTAAKFVEALLKAGVVVQRATRPFTVGSSAYPAGSFIVKTAQPFRAHVLDMFEPQADGEGSGRKDQDAGGEPYDISGWTLAYQMGVKFDRILEAVDGPFEIVDHVDPPPAHITGSSSPAGYILSHRQNDAFVAVNRLLQSGGGVFWLDNRLGVAGRGSIYVEATSLTRPIVERAAAGLGVSVDAVGRRPDGSAMKLRPPRIGLWDRYGGASTSGWVRWILERYEFPFERIYAQAFDAGHLADKYDVLILPDEAVPQRRAARLVLNLPAEYEATTGTISWERSVPMLKEFVERGGTLILIGHAASIASSVGAPIAIDTDHDSELYLPGTVLHVHVDNTVPLGYGFERDVNVFFDNSPVLKLTDTHTGATRVAWFDSRLSVRSGQAKGQEQLFGGLAVVDAAVGRGRVLVFGPEITFRAQSQGTFKFLFNALHYATATKVTFDSALDR